MVSRRIQISSFEQQIIAYRSFHLFHQLIGCWNKPVFWNSIHHFDLHANVAFRMRCRKCSLFQLCFVTLSHSLLWVNSTGFVGLFYFLERIQLWLPATICLGIFFHESDRCFYSKWITITEIWHLQKVLESKYLYCSMCSSFTIFTIHLIPSFVGNWILFSYCTIGLRRDSYLLIISTRETMIIVHSCIALC